MKIRVLLLGLLPSLLIISTVGIHFFEYQLTGNEETQYSSLFNSFYWTVVTIATVGFGDMSPQTFGGRFFTIFLIVGGVLQYSLLVSLVTSKVSEFRSGRERGLEKLNLREHILVCSDDPAWIAKIVEQNKSYAEEGRLAIISPQTSHPLLTTEYNKVRWVSGDPQQIDTLNKAAAQKAELAYVFFRESNLGLITVLQLETLSNGRIITLAQYVGHEFRKYFADVGCDHALDPYDLYVPMMLQAYRSQGGSSWVRGAVRRSEGHMLHTMHLPKSFEGKTWLEFTLATKGLNGNMPLGILMEEVVLINPSADHVLRPDSRIIQLESDSDRVGGDLDEHCIEVLGLEDLRLEGHLLINSDNPIFIERMLREMAGCELRDHIVVLTDQPQPEDLPENISVEWVYDPTNSEDSFRKARAAMAKVAFIDHLQDGQTLMAVLRLEQETDGEIFSIATFRDDNFDMHLLKVGCDFCIKFDDLVAPILAQSATNGGVGNLVTQLLSQELSTQSLFVRRLSYEWEPTTWLETIRNIKEKTNQLPVGLIRRGTNQLLINPHYDLEIIPGDSVIFIAQESMLRNQQIFDQNHVDELAHLVPRIDPASKQLPDHEVLTQEGFRLLRQGTEPGETYRVFLQAATLGNTEAKYQLGILHFKGRGMVKNLDEAYYWFREAAMSGHDQAQSVLSTIRILRETEKRFQELDEDIPEFSPELLKQFDAAQRRWFARMVVSMVQADGRIDLHERAFVHSAIQLLADSSDMLELEEFVLLGQRPPVEKIDLSEGLRHRVLDSLLNIATIDRHFDEAEETLLREIAEAAGADEKTITQLVEMGHTRVQQFHSTQLHAPNARARI